MIERTTRQATFVLEQSYAASPARVFAAWGDRMAKARWFGIPDESIASYELDFRVGGREINRVGPSDGPVYTYDARYQDIVPNQRIIYVYDMLLDETLISVSVTTVEFKPAGTGTRLIFTEHGVFLDGHEDPKGREQGTKFALKNLDADLQRGSSPENNE